MSIPSHFRVIPGDGTSIFRPGKIIGSGGSGSDKPDNEYEALYSNDRRLRHASCYDVVVNWSNNEGRSFPDTSADISVLGSAVNTANLWLQVPVRSQTGKRASDQGELTIRSVGKNATVYVVFAEETGTVTPTHISTTSFTHGGTRGLSTVDIAFPSDLPRGGYDSLRLLVYVSSSLVTDNVIYSFTIYEKENNV